MLLAGHGHLRFSLLVKRAHLASLSSPTVDHIVKGVGTTAVQVHDWVSSDLRPVNTVLVSRRPLGVSI